MRSFKPRKLCRYVGISVVTSVLWINPALGMCDEPDVKQLTPRQMIDALASTNAPPVLQKNDKQLLIEYGPTQLPIFPIDFDWENQENVLTTARELSQTESLEVWDEILKHFDDKRYCITLWKEYENPETCSVGQMCCNIAYHRLDGAFLENLGLDDRFLPLRIPLENKEFENLPAWRKNRQKSTWVEMQIEVGELVLAAIPKVQYISPERREMLRVQTQEKINTIKQTGIPHFEPFRRKLATFTPAVAERIRDRLNQGRQTEID